MSLTYDPRALFAAGKPLVYWVNRYDPHIVGNEVVAHSGKVAMIKTTVDAYVGKPMVIKFRLARKAYLDIWFGLVSSTTGFATTSLVDYFVTGRTVLFRLKNPIQYQNEILGENIDLDHAMFEVDTSPPITYYKKGFDLFRGTLNLIITA